MLCGQRGHYLQLTSAGCCLCIPHSLTTARPPIAVGAATHVLLDEGPSSGPSPECYHFPIRENHPAGLLGQRQKVLGGDDTWLTPIIHEVAEVFFLSPLPCKVVWRGGMLVPMVSLLSACVCATVFIKSPLPCLAGFLMPLGLIAWPLHLDLPSPVLLLAGISWQTSLLVPSMHHLLPRMTWMA